MSIAFSCPGCDKKLRVNDAMAGKKGKCPSCSNVFQVPNASEVVEELEEVEDRPVRAAGKSRRPDDDDVEEAPRPKKKRKSGGGGVAVVVTLSLLVLLGVGATVWWFWGSSGLSGTQRRYLPNNTFMVMSVDVEGVLNSDAYSSLKKELPKELIERLESDEGIIPTKLISRLTVAEGVDGEKTPSVTITETKDSITADTIKKNYAKNKAFEKLKWKELKEGSYTIYAMDFSTENFQPTEPFSCFCVPESKVVIQGMSDTVRAILKRDGKADLSDGMKAAIGHADFSKTLAIAVNWKGAPRYSKEQDEAKKGLANSPFKDTVDIVDGLEGMAVTINVKADIDVKVVAIYKDSGKADAAKKVVETYKSKAGEKIKEYEPMLLANVPPEAVENAKELLKIGKDIVDSTDISSSGNTVSVKATIKVDPIIKAVKPIINMLVPRVQKVPEAASQRKDFVPPPEPGRPSNPPPGPGPGGINPGPGGIKPNPGPRPEPRIPGPAPLPSRGNQPSGAPPAPPPG